MNKLFITILLFISLCLWAQNVPQTIDYQGRLADNNGNYLNSVVTVDFLIYDAETGGTLLWNETQDVSCANGIFHVLLGSMEPFASDLFDGADRWLELVVSGETLSPRTVVASVPYAIIAETAYNVEVPLNLSGNVSDPNSVITGENTGTGYGVYGYHASSGNYGYLGSPYHGVYGAANIFGVYGLHPSGNYGYIGSSDFGVFGSSNGNFGYLGSSFHGVYGNSSNYWAGYFEGNVHMTGDLTIDGSFSSIITYSVGDFAQGGIVFWVDETGQHGLVCAKTDQITGVRWYAGTYGDTQAKGDGPFSGEANTSIIIAAQVAIGDDGTTCAARICNELQITEGGKTYGDWYLPSKEELNLMYQNKSTIDASALANDGTAFVNGNYWSSTENSDNYAYRQFFLDGVQTFTYKSFTYGVRAVRGF